MIFDEEKAKTIVDRFNLNLSTMAVWRTRNSIPEKYFKENFEMPEKLNRQHSVLLSDILIRVLNNEKINNTYLSEISNVKKDKINDVARNKSSFSVQELLAIKIAVNKQRIEIKLLIKELEGKSNFTDKDSISIKKIIQNDLIVLRFFLGMGDGTDEGRIFDWKCGKQIDISNLLKSKIVNQTAVFLLETAL